MVVVVCGWGAKGVGVDWSGEEKSLAWGRDSEGQRGGATRVGKRAEGTDGDNVDSLPSDPLAPSTTVLVPALLMKGLQKIVVAFVHYSWVYDNTS